LRDYGLTEGKAGRELNVALDALPDSVDSDLDGASDQVELSLCMNPSGEELSEGPGFGCGAQLSPGAGAPGTRLGWFWCALGLVLVLKRRGTARPLDGARPAPGAS
jgi:hypothetical protein